MSFRRRRPAADPGAWALIHAAAQSAALWDWPVELGPEPELGLRPPRIASLHTRLAGESLAAAIQRLHDAGAGAELLKLAVPIYDLTELLYGHAWVQRAPDRHQFLPACPLGSGRWSWYRLWRGAGQRLNFVRERAAAGNAPSADQPTLYEWLVRHQAPTSAAGGPQFAALLGDPVAHSRTPAEQRPYFHKYGWPVFLIAVTDADLRAGEPLPILAELGLRAAAVTAPRKVDGRAWLAAAGGDVLRQRCARPDAGLQHARTVGERRLGRHQHRRHRPARRLAGAVCRGARPGRSAHLPVGRRRDTRAAAHRVSPGGGVRRPHRHISHRRAHPRLDPRRRSLGSGPQPPARMRLAGGELAAPATSSISTTATTPLAANTPPAAAPDTSRDSASSAPRPPPSASSGTRF